MNRTHGSTDLPLVECINPYIDKYLVRWDIRTETVSDDEQEPHTEASYYEHTFSHKPTLEEIQEVVYAQINEDTQREITSGYTWHGDTVWLSSENQFNYKAAYDLVIQTDGKALPVTIKVGTISNPQYIQITTTKDMEDFFVGAVEHIRTTVKNGWQKKDAINWNEYEQLLN